MRSFLLCRNAHEREFTPEYVKIAYKEGSPPQGLSEARRGRDVLLPLSANVLQKLIRRGGAPPGAAVFIADN